MDLLPCRMKLMAAVVLLLMAGSCRERYNVPYPSSDTGYLVVEGAINPQGETSIVLSRATKLGTRNILHESGAIMEIQGDDNSTYPLTESDSGLYRGPDVTLNNNANYRLHIRTSNNKEYISNYTKPLITPPIDSISWTRDNNNGGVSIFLTTHDPESKIIYYKWDYDEVFEFRAHYATRLKYDLTYNGSDIVYAEIGALSPTDSILICWKYQSSSKVFIGSSENLSEKLIFTPILQYPQGAFELSRLYSINIKQHALSKDAYQFYLKMKKNTESLGTIFDPQPSEIKGNVTCVTDPAEQVIGYIEAASVQTKRKFIANTELPGWNFSEECQTDTLELSSKNILAAYYKNFYPTEVIMGGMAPPVFISTPAVCADCRLRGTNQRPSFWP
jgi:hypothetical protein